MSRLRPSRLGLVSIAEYNDDVFQFSGGRLVLRGQNGAGKSKALELSLPFLFDGEKHPRNFDSFGGQSKRVKDLVLWSGQSLKTFQQRTGWIWLELEQEGNGATRHVTVGAGLHAARERPDVDARYFILEGPRIGHEARLVEGQDVVSFKRLPEALGPGARIFDQARAFREAQNELLFGFDSRDRYKTMVNLLRELRRPNLSSDMDPDRVAQVLRDTLPPVDGQLVARIGTLLDELDEIGREQARLEQARESVSEFEQHYVELARATARDRARAMREADREVSDTAARAEALERELGGTRTGLAAARERREALERELEEIEASLRELRASPEARSAEALEAQELHLSEARRTLDELGRAADSAASTLAEAERRAAGSGDLLARGERRLDAAVEAARVAAAAAGVAEHDPLAAPLAVGGTEAREGLATLSAALDARGEAAREQRRLEGRRDRLTAVERARQDERDRAAARLQQASERRAEVTRQLEQAVDAYGEAVASWADGLTTLLLTSAERDQLAARAARPGESEHAPEHAASTADGPRALVANRAEAQREDLLRRAGEARAERERLAGERDELATERERLAALPDPETPPLHTRDPAARENARGAPLWRLVEFRIEVGEDARAGIEAALEGRVCSTRGWTRTAPPGARGTCCSSPSRSRRAAGRSRRR